jgi:hypothetical protein
MRMALYPDHYNSPAIKKITSPNHLSHCVEMFRQSIQCATDITPLPFRFGPNENGLLGTFRSDTVHMCRDFERVRKWAASRPASEELKKVIFTKPENHVGNMDD